MVNWRFFIGACILSGGLLFKAGAPVPAVAVGIGAAAFVSWRRQRSTQMTGDRHDTD
jgi:hypothetical protein